MHAHQHPAYPEEQSRLSRTGQIVTGELERITQYHHILKDEVDVLLKESAGEYSPELVSKSALLQGIRSRWLALPFLLEKPYFARMNFHESKTGQLETIYLGKIGVQHDGQEWIVDWRAPVASIYYSGQQGQVSYQVPSLVTGENNTVRGELLLKRQFVIENRELRQIFDRTLSVNDELLQAVLESGAGQRLKEVVATIQSEQNAIIRADKDQVVIVQGVAGSGKTTVALHRLAYLIYAHRDVLAPNRILIVGPNELFMNYISEVLPELGVNDVQQTTLPSLARLLIGCDLPLRDGNADLRRLIHGADRNDPRFRLARFKGTLGMQRLLDGYVRHLEEQLLPAFDLQLLGETAATRGDIFHYMVSECWFLPLTARMSMIRNFCRLRLKQKVEDIAQSARIACDRAVDDIKIALGDGGERRHLIGKQYDLRDQTIQAARKGVTPALNRYMQQWPAWNLTDLYSSLFDHPDSVAGWSDGALSPERACEFASCFQSGVAGPEPFGHEDLAALVYLQSKVFGWRTAIRPQHIVIDEAQDCSAFQFQILRMLAVESSFTIVGDLAQGIHNYRSIRSWDDLTGVVFADEPGQLLKLTRSYRTATEIMEFANQVIDSLAPGRFDRADPVLRHCPPPQLIHVDPAGTPGVIHQAVRDMQSKGCRSIAVIGKSDEECLRLHTGLAEMHSDPVFQLISGDARDFTGRLAVVPVSLAKGLEFDGVILPDVSEASYHLEELDVKLFYVACTRAMHRLSMVCPGKESPIFGRINPNSYTRQRPE